ncbi:N5-carboxyaminoimidazole ribonucleotide synthase [Paenibacillus polymyxa]|uniref:5-(carboxyamino)imidazole ribonucleotide synthase n=1 Tax=Paenibacillus polymyxa TaxID=1406 RepID=UPI0008FB21D6|nr:5-(carboxyamino)imidazole ribonucleotide synthase [Paenibacillus polymyxa]APB77576.1 5-(carboxyamino)imidazole ribonucleotide synthase [Paenibacillus polymyxa]APQ57997.1 phosphoribosylaminoimidazole carboxylase [Paenibacillus polymyxa]VUG08413.1 N5-carboxyaminoimidazole ribonucleotide synthase [Paenibacillus polymyxa]
MNGAGEPTGRIRPPGTTIGLLGGGQLGRMLVLAGTNLGYRFVTLDPTPDSPCGQVSEQIRAAYDDEHAARELAERCDVITYEFENVDAGVAALLEQESSVPQGSSLLYTTQHRLREKRSIEAAGVPVAPYREISSLADMVQAVAELGVPCVLKTAVGGYDGKGQVVIRQPEEATAAYEQLAGGGAELVLEQFIRFRCEISVIVARSTNGEAKAFPPAENIHVNNILHTSIVPARVPEPVQEEARKLALAVAESLGAVGLLAVEMFVTEDGQLYVNELAPRPHNSGHYTMEGCATSQFEQHIRAICGLPLGSTKLLTSVVMVNVLGEHLEGVVRRFAQSDVEAERLDVVPKLHLYGKSEAKPGRKMGHINLLCQDAEQALEWIEQTNIWGNK